jgi:bromodomain-containing protein 8
MMQDMPVVVRLARQLYSQRLEELKKAISEDEEKFLALVSEIEDIRSGKLDNQLLRNENAEEQGSEPIENESTEPLEDKKQDEHQMEKEKEITDKADNEKPNSDGIEDHTMSENDRIEENNMLNQPENPKEEKIQEAQYNEEPEIKKESMDDKVEKEKKITDATEEIPTTLIEQKNAADNKNDSDQSPAIENTQPEQVGDMTSDAVKTSRKRVADEDALTSYELETKRARREEQISSDVDHEIENAPLTVDTARTDYSTGKGKKNIHKFSF